MLGLQGGGIDRCHRLLWAVQIKACCQESQKNVLFGHGKFPTDRCISQGSEDRQTGRYDTLVSFGALKAANGLRGSSWGPFIITE